MGVVNSITKFLAVFYLLLQRSHRMKSFVTQSRIELWLLAIIVCMQTEEKEREKKELFNLPILSVVKIM